MAKLLPKKVLDEALLAELTKYYKIDTSADTWDPQEFVEHECFSHPSLEYHDCNIRAKLLGGHDCNYCNHVPGRPCRVSCDFQHFCLGVFAWRLGIGGEDLSAAIKHNLYSLTNEALYLEVIKKFSDEEIEDAGLTDTAVEEPAPLQLEDDPPEPEAPDIVDEDDSADPWLTIKEAAEYYECTYCNIYNYVSKGRIPSITRGKGNKKRILIRTSVIEAFKQRPRNNKKS